MAHHGGEDFAKLLHLQTAAIDEQLGRLGATGRFPEGKLNEHDEGEIRFAVGVVQEKVTINFNKPIAALGMTADQADELARVLIKHAMAVRARGGR